MNKDLDKALKEKFLCQTKFTQDIENLVKDTTGLNYIDAIELNFMKKTSRAKLPL